MHELLAAKTFYLYPILHEGNKPCLLKEKSKCDIPDACLNVVGRLGLADQQESSHAQSRSQS